MNSSSHLLNRRAFLARSAGALALGWLAGNRLLAQAAATSPTSAPAAAAPTPPPAVHFRPLRRGVGVFTGRGGTIGWLSSRDGLAVVDTQFPETAALCLAGLPDRGDRPLDVVFNTHHHGDHTSGNGTFRPVAKAIVAQANVPGLQRAAAERAKPPTVDRQVYADVTFQETWRATLGDEVMSARYFGPAHTNGDAVVLFEKANVVHLGDLVFNRLYPVIDRVSGASIRHWIVVLEQVVRDYPADAIYIFGHAGAKHDVTGQRGDLLVMRDYFTVLLDHVQAQIRAGATREQIVKLENLPGVPDFHQPLPNRLGANLGVAFDELTQNASS